MVVAATLYVLQAMISLVHEHPTHNSNVSQHCAAVQDFMLGNKLFIVCEYMPYSLLQLLEGAAEPLDPSASSSPPPGQLLQHMHKIALVTAI